MTLKNILGAISLSALGLASNAFSEEVKKLKTDVELGVISTTGNSVTTSLKGKVDLKQELEALRNHLVLSGYYRENEVTLVSDGETVRENRKNAEKYFASLQTDFKLNSEQKGLFVFGSYTQDEFSGFEYQGTLALGYSDRLFKFDNSQLTYSVGPGISFAETKDVVDGNGNVTTEGENETFGIIRLSADFLYQISENAKFTQSFSSDAAISGGDNSKTRAETALTANVMTGLALKTSYIIDHNTHVPDGTKHADTQTAITFLLSF